MSTQPLPLAGVTVVAVEQAVAAPFATRQLADLGARVVKIERPDGGDFARGYDTAARGLASHFVWCNRGKESVAVDLKDPRGLALVRRMVAGADVFVQNLAQGAAARLGLDAATLCAAHPWLIAVDVSGYGAEGPYAHKRAYDMLVQCEAGLVSVTGTPEQPVKSGSRPPTSRPGCTPSPVSSPPSSGAARPAVAVRWRSPCWTRSPSGWGIRCTTGCTGARPRRARGSRTR